METDSISDASSPTSETNSASRPSAASTSVTVRRSPSEMANDSFQNRREAVAGARGHLDDLRVVQPALFDAGCHVADTGKGEHLDPHMAGDNGLGHGLGL